MVNGISFNGGYNAGQYSSKDIENVARYAIGTTTVAEQSNPFDGMLPMLALTGLTGIPSLFDWFKKAKDNGGAKEVFTKELETMKNGFGSTKSMFTNGGWKSGETYKGIWRNYSADIVSKAIPNEERVKLLTEDAQKNYKKANEYAKLAREAKTPELASKALRIANARLARAEQLASIQIKPQAISEAKGFAKVGAFFSNLGSGISKVTGFSKLVEGTKVLATKSPAVASVLKFAKGNGAFAAITGALALFTDVIPAFGLGADKGIAQIAKSTIKTAATVGGWAGGAAVGAAIGSIIPGAGTLIGGAIGGLLGVVCGSIGSWAADKVADAVVGKSEVEIAKEEEAEKLAQQAKKDPKVTMQLLATAQQKLQTEDPSSAEAQEAKVSIEHLTQVAQSQQTSQGQAPSQAQLQEFLAAYTKYQQSTATNPFAG